MVYYIVGYLPRYREPLDGLALLLAATAVYAPLRRQTEAKAAASPGARGVRRTIDLCEIRDE